MELSDYLREPTWATVFAIIITVLYIHGKNKLNNEGDLPTSSYAKPAALVGLLTYFIVSMGVGGKETISSEPF